MKAKWQSPESPALKISYSRQSNLKCPLPPLSFNYAAVLQTDGGQSYLSRQWRGEDRTFAGSLGTWMELWCSGVPWEIMEKMFEPLLTAIIHMRNKP
jgi:hypothetical protein